MRKRIHIMNGCNPLLKSRVRPSKVVQVFLLSLLFASLLGTACGQRNNDNERLPGVAIPVHILTTNDVGRTVDEHSARFLCYRVAIS